MVLRTMKRGCIAIIAFDRFAHLRRVLDCLKECIGLSALDIFISFDAMPTNGESSMSQRVELGQRAVCEFAEWCSAEMPSVNVEIVQQAKNLRVHKHKTTALRHVFDDQRQYDYVLFLEDDVVLCRDALQWFTTMLDWADEDDKQMRLITGFSHNLLREKASETFEKGLIDVMRNPVLFDMYWYVFWPNPWGFVVTRQNWEMFLRDVWSGYDREMFQILKRHGGICASPCITRTVHIGRSGTNANHVSFFPEHVLTADDDPRGLDKLEPSRWRPCCDLSRVPRTEMGFDEDVIGTCQNAVWQRLQPDRKEEKFRDHTQVLFLSQPTTDYKTMTLLSEAYDQFRSRYTGSVMTRRTTTFDTVGEVSGVLFETVVSAAIVFVRDEDSLKIALDAQKEHRPMNLFIAVVRLPTNDADTAFVYADPERPGVSVSMSPSVDVCAVIEDALR